MFYDEEVVLDIRLNSLKNSVDCFVVVESKFYHNGKKRDLKFDINKYPKFKEKIIYIVQDEEPLNLETVKKEDDEGIKSYKYIFNAHKRENFQRNLISKGLEKANEDDLIMISDVDEIPNLKDLNVARVNNKIVIFEQNIFYYKLNRYLEGFTWHGTKACKKKNLKSPQWIRNVKNKKFGFWRLDTFFSENKYINKIFIKNGGWHFSNLKNPEDIENKLKSYLHHRDFDVENIDLKEISKLMKNNETIYDMFADKAEKKFSENKKKLSLYPKNDLPQYILNNENKFKEWLD
jgi:beta-1,4-mannosyl-glycoprotein beta-1,4-N-acetylglucosaminyltransferase